MRVHQYDSKELASSGAATHIKELLQQSDDGPALLLFSGGSALSIVDAIDPGLLGPHITIAVLDERVGVDEADLNFYMLKQTLFFEHVLQHGVNVISPGSKLNETVEAQAARMERALRAWRQEHADGVIIITQGVGSDGHTAGIMPYPDDMAQFDTLFNQPHQWVVGYNSFDKNEFPERVTVTVPFLIEQVDHSVVFVVGEHKQGVLERVMDTQGLLNKLPAGVIHQMKDVTIFTDIKL